MTISEKNGDLSTRRGKREKFVHARAGDVAGALGELLDQGGILLSTDEELLTHVDFWLVYGFLENPLVEVVARHVEAQGRDRTALVFRARTGRIRDRHRAARILGRLKKLDEESHAVLHGLVRDPVPVVWRAASRSAWRQALKTRMTFEYMEARLTNTGGSSPDRALTRHLAGGLTGLLPREPLLGRKLLQLALGHPEVWTRASAAIACAEAALLAPRSRAIRSLFGRALTERGFTMLPSLALGLRDAGRATNRRRMAQKLGVELEEHLSNADRVDLEEDDQMARERTRRLLSCLAVSYQSDGSVKPVGVGAKIERALGLAAGGRTSSAYVLLLDAVQEAHEVMDKAASIPGTTSTVETRVPLVCAFQESAERLAGEGLTDPLTEVVATDPVKRLELLGALRELHARLHRSSTELARAKSFFLGREGARAQALVAEAGGPRLRAEVTALIARLSDSRTRLYAAGALARLFDRLRHEDTEGFCEVALRIAMLPGKRYRGGLERVIQASSDRVARPYLQLILQSVEEIRGGAASRRCAELVSRIIRGSEVLEPNWGSAAYPSVETSVSCAEDRVENRTLDALSLLTKTLRYAGEAGDLAGLEALVEVLIRFERNLTWTQALPETTLGLTALADRISRVSRGGAVGREELRGLSSGVERELSSVFSTLLVRALRRAARVRPWPDEEGSSDRFVEGATVHGYEVLKPMGRTSMSAVYLGLRRSTRERVVLKTPSPLVRSHEKALELFRREGRLLRLVRSEHVVKVEEIFDEGPTLLVLQYLRGRAMDHYLGADKEWLLRRCLQVLRGLRHVHECGIVHRDLKPHNVVILPSSRAVLIDFGLASWVGDERATGVQGTPEYAAPEQWDRPPTPAADIYALGVMLYEILGGRLPHDPEDMRDPEYRRCLPAPPPLPRAVPDCLRATNSAMLSRDPRARPLAAGVREGIELALSKGLGNLLA